ncbi:hypothetical protein V1505DRAFT_410315 [Lipomyces doorenjongii]
MRDMTQLLRELCGILLNNRNNVGKIEQPFRRGSRQWLSDKLSLGTSVKAKPNYANGIRYQKHYDKRSYSGSRQMSLTKALNGNCGLRRSGTGFRVFLANLTTHIFTVPFSTQQRTQAFLKLMSNLRFEHKVRQSLPPPYRRKSESVYDCPRPSSAVDALHDGACDRVRTRRARSTRYPSYLVHSGSRGFLVVLQDCRFSQEIVNGTTTTCARARTAADVRA